MYRVGEYMLNRFSDKAQKIIATAENLAFEMSKNSVGTEHLLLALLKSKDNKLKTHLEQNKITFDVIKEKVIELFGKSENKPLYMQYTNSFKVVLENALFLSKKKGEDKVSIDSMIVALLENEECVAYELLNKFSISTSVLSEEIKKQIKKSSELDCVLELTNLNIKAKKATPILIHREKEIKTVIEILLRKQKPNAVIVGDPGVGKTALVEYIAHLINKQEVPDAIKDKVIYELDISSLIAGTKYRGEFEEKLKKILKKVKDDKNAILFIDEIHNIVGAGGAEGAIDASNIIKPYLSRGDICCIGATTYDEYIKLFEKEKALERRFYVVNISEPTLNQSIDILLALKESFSKYHKIEIEDKQIKEIVGLCNNYVFQRQFPDKAIDVLDMSCVRSKNKKEKKLSKQTIIEIIENNFNVKIETENKAKILQNQLNNCLVGQKEAISKICTQIKFIELGLFDKNKPLGVFLFVGATGVGKTECAKQIAYNYFGSMANFIKLDMSEYSESNCVNKMLGSPPGYVGYEKQSLLVDHIRRKPHSVIVLDEVEKAHRDILDVFLNVFDEGYFYDSNKRKIDFTNSIIIMTSNLGFSEELFHKGKLGFVNNKTNQEDIKGIIEKHFRPEFLNRIDKLIYFNTLNENDCEQLANIYLNEYIEKTKLDIPSETIIKNTIKDSDALRYGARGIKRKVKNEIFMQMEKINSL